MRFSTIIPFVLASVAMAAPTPVEREAASLVQRDYATVSSVLADVQAKTTTLNSKASAFTGTQAQVSDIQAASDTLLSTINAGTQTISNTSPLTLKEALDVANQSDSLAKTVNGTIDTFISKKSTAVAASAGKKVYTALINQKTAAQNLVNAIKSKVPSNAQSIAESKGKAITDALQRGINAYADQA